MFTLVLCYYDKSQQVLSSSIKCWVSDGMENRITSFEDQQQNDPSQDVVNDVYSWSSIIDLGEVCPWPATPVTSWKSRLSSYYIRLMELAFWWMGTNWRHGVVLCYMTDLLIKLKDSTFVILISLDLIIRKPDILDSSIYYMWKLPQLSNLWTKQWQFEHFG